MARESCANCIYMSVNKDEFHFGAEQPVDYYCECHMKWLHELSGKCREYVSKD